MEALYTTTHKIWRIVYDAQQHLLLLEIRDENARQAFLAAINLANRQLLWDEGALEEPWWISLGQASEGRVYVHVFDEAQQQPIPKTLLCLDALRGEGLWQIEGAALEEVGIGCLRMADGKILQASNAQPLQKEQWKALENSQLQLPERYFEQEAHFATVADFLQKYAQIAPVFAIDYWESDTHIAIGYTKQVGIFLDTHLLLLTANGEEIGHYCLQTGAKGIGSESFMVAKTQLIFIQNKQELYAIDL